MATKALDQMELDSQLCKDASGAILTALSDYMVNDRELVTILASITLSIGAILEDIDPDTIDRDTMWAAYKKNNSLGYALIMSGLDMLEYWAKVEISKQD